MTGFGLSESQNKNYSVRVEIKSLNGKFLDLNVRLPRILNEREHLIRNEFGKQIIRGSVSLNIHLEKREDQVDPLRLNRDLAQKYYDELSSLATELNAETRGLFTSITSLPDVLRTEESPLNDDDWEMVLQTCKEAFEQLDAYRKSEGNELKELLAEHNKKIFQDLLPQVGPYEEHRREEMRKRLLQSLKESASNVNHDKNRFEQELIFYLEKYDISEEKNRLSTHCQLFNEELEKGSGGKKLGFIAQEIGREINTMGAKAYHAPLQKVVIEMKEELEKIKEQVLNVL